MRLLKHTSGSVVSMKAEQSALVMDTASRWPLYCLLLITTVGNSTTRPAAPPMLSVPCCSNSAYREQSSINLCKLQRQKLSIELVTFRRTWSSSASESPMQSWSVATLKLQAWTCVSAQALSKVLDPILHVKRAHSQPAKVIWETVRVAKL